MNAFKTLRLPWKWQALSNKRVKTTVSCHHLTETKPAQREALLRPCVILLFKFAKALLQSHLGPLAFILKSWNWILPPDIHLTTWVCFIWISLYPCAHSQEVDSMCYRIQTAHLQKGNPLPLGYLLNILLYGLCIHIPSVYCNSEVPIKSLH